MTGDARCGHSSVRCHNCWNGAQSHRSPGCPANPIVRLAGRGSSQRGRAIMRRAIDRSFVARLLLSLALMSVSSVEVCAQTAWCSTIGEPVVCYGSGGDSEVATGNPAEASGGDGGDAPWPADIGNGGPGGSATATASDSVARGDISVWASAVGGPTEGLATPILGILSRAAAELEGRRRPTRRAVQGLEMSQFRPRRRVAPAVLGGVREVPPAPAARRRHAVRVRRHLRQSRRGAGTVGPLKAKAMARRMRRRLPRQTLAV